MRQVAGEIAYHHIWEAMSGTRPPESFLCEDIAFERLRRALIDTGLSSLDRALRLRHALRYADLCFASNERYRLPLPIFTGWPDHDQCQYCSLTVRAGSLVEALPWKPVWLQNVPVSGVDATAMRSLQRQWLNHPPIADYWLKDMLGFDEFRGPGQALAVRSALHMPKNKTLLIILPTGEGKSLVFQAIAAANPEKTVAVVVPTVALAQNHAEATCNCDLLHPEHPHAYIGGQTATNEIILSAIQNGTQGLVFAAPEAFVGKLRQPLITAANGGFLAALVIDEAHLVDAWGTAFRSEFQLLSALIAELRAATPSDQQPSVICLSATVTQETLRTLEVLFSPMEPISIVPAARLRPEPDIWISPVSNDTIERKERVIEALYHLPRPALLYVTKQDQAIEWQTKLQQIGYKRVGIVHGGTRTDDRAKVVKLWRSGNLDIVVGTSAFGLGIDYPHVRTVIHACIPESLDRYYQEVGRSGRDNCASIALLLPDAADYAIAKGLLTTKIISIEKGRKRWISMFNSATHDRTERILVDPATRTDYDPDMSGERHQDWNGRVLNLMSRSRMIRLSGLRYDQDRNQTLVAIDILDDGHKEEITWKKSIEPIRQKILANSQDALHGMEHLIENRTCPSTLFRELYRLSHKDRDFKAVLACGGCDHCRTQRKEGWFADWPNAPASPWPIGKMDNRLLQYCDRNRCFVERSTHVVETVRQSRLMKEFLDGLWENGLRKCIILGATPEFLREVLATRPWCVVQGQDSSLLSSNGLPAGPELVWVAKDNLPKTEHFAESSVGNERIFLLPPNPDDPLNPGRPLADRFFLHEFTSIHDILKT